MAVFSTGYFQMLLLKVREMMFFMLTNDFSDEYREERLEKFKIQSELDQKEFDEQIDTICNT